MRNEVALCSKMQEFHVSIIDTLVTSYVIIFNSAAIELERPFSSRSFFESGRGISAFLSGKWKSMDDPAEPLQHNVHLVAHRVGSPHAMRNELYIPSKMAQERSSVGIL